MTLKDKDTFQKLSKLKLGVNYQKRKSKLGNNSQFLLHSTFPLDGFPNLRRIRGSQGKITYKNFLFFAIQRTPSRGGHGYDLTVGFIRSLIETVRPKPKPEPKL